MTPSLERVPRRKMFRRRPPKNRDRFTLKDGIETYMKKRKRAAYFLGESLL
jgi:hypothetical protein